MRRSAHPSLRRNARHATAPTMPTVANSRSWPGRTITINAVPTAHTPKSTAPTGIAGVRSAWTSARVAMPRFRHSEAVPFPHRSIDHPSRVHDERSSHPPGKDLRLEVPISRVIDKKDERVGSIGEILDRSIIEHGVVFAHLRAGMTKQLDHADGWTLADISDIRLVRPAERQDHRSIERADGCAHEINDMTGHRVVNLARGRDQSRELGRRLHDEPRIDRDAVSANTGAWPQETHPWVAASKLDRVPNVDADALSDQRELVRKGDIHVPVRVLHQLHELGCRRVGLDELAGRERAVYLRRGLGGCRIKSSDDAVVRDELDHEIAGKNALGAVREEKVGTCAPAGTLEGAAKQTHRRTRRHRRLEDDQVAAFEHARH